VIPVYRHTQFGTLTIALIAGVILILGATIPLFGPHPITVSIMVLLGILGSLFASMTVAVDHRSVRIAFGPGWPRRDVSIPSIRRAEAIRTRWYDGWGIHATARGLLYNVSGFDAVDVTLTDGRHILIGTDQPADLQAAILEAKGREPAT